MDIAIHGRSSLTSLEASHAMGVVHGLSGRMTSGEPASGAHRALRGVEPLNDIQVVDTGDGDLIAIGQPCTVNNLVRHHAMVGALLEAATGVLGTAAVVLALARHGFSVVSVPANTLTVRTESRE